MNRKAGKIQRHQLHSNRALRYYLYVPTNGGNNASVLVSVHGISRNAVKHAEHFSQLAERYNVVVVAPLFDQQHYPGYQRLGLSGKRADLALNQILDEVAQQTQANTKRIYMFGYSGGGQFVHRYAMAYPTRVAAITIGAAGWYTFPDLSQRFPYGMAPHPKLAEIQFNMRQCLHIPAYVLVGEQDTLRDDALRQSDQLDQQQGSTRFERGQQWIHAMQQASKLHGLNTDFRFISLPNSDHSFTRSIKSGGMAERVFECLFDSTPKIPGTCSPHDEMAPASAVNCY